MKTIPVILHLILAFAAGALLASCVDPHFKTSENKHETGWWNDPTRHYRHHQHMKQ